ncbi:MAG: hypothetical protein WA655_14195 [Candidatus Korobacteraceae bacterium]
MKWHDEIVDEVRAAREAYAAKLNFELVKIFEDLKKKEKAHPQDLAALQPVVPKPKSVLSR